MIALRTIALPVADAVGVVPYLAIQSMLGSSAPHGMHDY